MDKNSEVKETKEEKFNEQELLKKVEKAAEKGASKGSKKSQLISILVSILLVFGIGYYISNRLDLFKTSVSESLSTLVHFDNKADEHDLVINDKGILGYTAADFEEAILGDSSKLKKIEVFEQELSEATTVTETGFINWSALTKSQVVTYKGKVVYTVDLSKLKNSDIEYDEENAIITMYIPHAAQEEINIPESEIQVSDTVKGMLAIGEIKLTVEQIAEIQQGARFTMQKKLSESNTQENADRFAKLVVWEMYSPIVKGVAKNCSLEVEFKD